MVKNLKKSLDKLYNIMYIYNILGRGTICVVLGTLVI